jgi:hypothetical protein
MAFCACEAETSDTRREKATKDPRCRICLGKEGAVTAHVILGSLNTSRDRGPSVMTDVEVLTISA